MADDEREWSTLLAHGWPGLCGLSASITRTPSPSKPKWALGGMPHANGAMSQKFIAPTKMPPGARMASRREIIQFLRHPRQARYLALMNTGASPGFCVMAYQAREVAYGSCEARKCNRVRPEGSLSEARDAARGSLTQRDKVGYCPCCVRATHVAIPGAYPLGPYRGVEYTGIRLWAESGPWAPWRLAAIDYPMRFIDCFPHPAGRDWAA